MINVEAIGAEVINTVDPERSIDQCHRGDWHDQCRCN